MASEIVGERRRTNAALQKGEKGRLNMTMTVTFLVVTDDVFATREDVLLNTANAPVVGMTYGPLGLQCISKSIERLDEHALYWEMTCEFDSAKNEYEQDPRDPVNPDPTTWRTIIEWNHSTENWMSKAADVNGNMYKNTAGELIDPLPQTRRTLCSTEFTQFESSDLTLKSFADRNNTINSPAFYGFPEHCLLLNVLNSTLGIYNGFPCWSVRYRLTYAPEYQWGTLLGNPVIIGGWITPYVSFGWNYKAAGKLELYMTPQSNHIFGPLDVNGNKTADPPNADDAHKFTRQEYDQLDFRTFIRTP